MDTESAVWRRYLGWAEAGAILVEGLADHPDQKAIWPGEAPIVRSADPVLTEVDEETIEAARTRGWLVSRPGPMDGRRHALSGLAVAVKDNIDVAGLPTRNGTPSGLWREPVSSAPSWDKLAQAGAWCAGKSAMHEMAWGVTTASTPGPIDEDRMTGGSSGGSAAVVAAGVVPAALGTDTGGSIRIPAALCGVVGLRPTHGAVSAKGVTPLAPAQDVVGPIAADVETAALIFEIISERAIMPTVDGIRGQRIGILKRPGRLEPEVEATFGRTLAGLADSGAMLIDVDTMLARVASSVSLLRMLVSAAAEYADGVRRDPDAYGPEARALLTLGGELPVDTRTLKRATSVVAIETAKLFADHGLDVMVTPTCPCVAPRRSADSVEIGDREEHVDAALTRYTAWAAVTGQPALSVPAPPSGPLPVGIQIMAAPGREVDCLRTALTIEQFTPQQKGR